jgi:putative transposase
LNLCRASSSRINNARKQYLSENSGKVQSHHKFEPQLPVSPNLLNREFCVDAPNMVWVSDMTYVWTSEGWLYLPAIKDLYSGRIVGWAMDKQMTQQLVIDELNQAVGRHHPPRGG